MYPFPLKNVVKWKWKLTEIKIVKYKYQKLLKYSNSVFLLNYYATLPAVLYAVLYTSFFPFCLVVSHKVYVLVVSS